MGSTHVPLPQAQTFMPGLHTTLSNVCRRGSTALPGLRCTQETARDHSALLLLQSLLCRGDEEAGLFAREAAYNILQHMYGAVPPAIIKDQVLTAIGGNKVHQTLLPAICLQKGKIQACDSEQHAISLKASNIVGTPHSSGI